MKFDLKNSTLFTGRTKRITIPIIVIVALSLFPFTIGALLAYAAYRYIPQQKLKYSAIALIAIPTLFIGSAWVSAFFSGSDSAKTVSKQSTSVTPDPSNNGEMREAINATPSASPELVTDTQPPVVEGILVTKVVDGDTIQLEDGTTVRYIGIDTPETVHPSKPVGCFGKEASSKNKEIVEDKRVRLEKDVSETDKYGRSLRYVYVGDTFVNDYLVRQGYATAVSYPPDVKYQDQFRAAEQEARTDKRGLWGSCPSETTTATEPTAPKATPKPQQTTTASTPAPKPATTSSSSGTYTGGDKDCGDFATHDEAQAFFISQGGPTKDPHKLDRDGDGIACETLP